MRTFRFSEGLGCEHMFHHVQSRWGLRSFIISAQHSSFEHCEPSRILGRIIYIDGLHSTCWNWLPACMCLGSSRPSEYACDFANYGHTFTQFLGDLALAKSIGWTQVSPQLWFVQGTEVSNSKYSYREVTLLANGSSRVVRNLRSQILYRDIVWYSCHVVPHIAG